MALTTPTTDAREPAVAAADEQPATWWQTLQAYAVWGAVSLRYSAYPHRHRVNFDGRLWVGDLASAWDTAALARDGITHVVSVTQMGLAAVPRDRGQREYYVIDIDDTPQHNLRQHLDDAVAFIDAALRADSRHQVLVHCNHGRSRSATVAAAYLMRAFHFSAAQAVSLLREKRAIVCPNAGFLRQLREYGDALRAQPALLLAPVPPASPSAPVRDVYY